MEVKGKMPLDLTNQDNPDLIKGLLKEIPKDFHKDFRKGRGDGRNEVDRYCFRKR